LEEWFFPIIKPFFSGEVIWILFFFIALLYTYGQTLGLLGWAMFIL
jgi:hypothetical protein